MLFHIRRKEGGIDSFSAGTFVDARGNSMHLRKDEFTLEPAGPAWTSPTTGAAYPLRWKISVPKLGIALESSTSLPSQEVASPSGWVPAFLEGAVIFTRPKGALPIRLLGYLAIT